MNYLVPILLCLTALGCTLTKKPIETWKLYKNSALDQSSYFLILDMQYFGVSIQEEECKNLKTFYSNLHPSRDFICRKNFTTKNPIEK